MLSAPAGSRPSTRHWGDGSFSTSSIDRSLKRRPPARPEPSESTDASDRRPALQVDRISQPGIVRDISFSLAAGEVLGISGGDIALVAGVPILSGWGESFDGLVPGAVGDTTHAFVLRPSLRWLPST